MAKIQKNQLKSFLKNFKLNEKIISQFLGMTVIVVIGILIFNSLKKLNEKSVNSETATESEKLKEGTEAGLIQGETKIIPEGLPTEYIVQKGDYLWKISEKFYHSGYNWVDIAKTNNLKSPNLVSQGQKLTIPRTDTIIPGVVKTELKNTNPITGKTYQVEKDDNLWKISLRAYGDGYQWIKIAQANKLINPNLIHSGNTLIIPR